MPNPALREDLTVPVAAKDISRLPINPQTKRFDEQAFVYDADQHWYFCPAGKPLPRYGAAHDKRGDHTVQQIVYRCEDCDVTTSFKNQIHLCDKSANRSQQTVCAFRLIIR